VIHNFQEFIAEAATAADSIWYHITTEENLASIKRMGYIDPKKTVHHKTIFWRPDSDDPMTDAEDTLTYPFWLMRVTHNYILLTVRIEHEDKSTQTGANFMETEEKVPVKNIIAEQKIRRKKLRDVTVLKNDDAKLIVTVGRKPAGESGSSFWMHGDYIVWVQKVGEGPYFEIYDYLNKSAFVEREVGRKLYNIMNDGIKKEEAHDLIEWLTSHGFTKTS